MYVKMFRVHVIKPPEEIVAARENEPINKANGTLMYRRRLCRGERDDLWGKSSSPPARVYGWIRGCTVYQLLMGGAVSPV